MFKIAEKLKKFLVLKKRRYERAAASSAASAETRLDQRLVFQLTKTKKRVPSLKQVKHLPRFLSPKEKFILKTLIAVAAVSIAGLGMKFASAHLIRVPARGGEYVEAAVGSPRTINPVLPSANDVDLDLTRLIFSGLIKTDAQGKLVADLADSYNLSSDGRTYVFRLKKNINWHDGTPFDSADVVATFAAIKNPAWKSPLAAGFKNVTITAPDADTVVFALNQPFAPFLSMLTVGIIPNHLWKEIKPENAGRTELNIKPIGTGPFKFKSLAKDKKGAIRSYTLIRNETYHGEPPLLSSFTVKFFPDMDAAAQALLKKNVDGLSFLPLKLRSKMQKLRTMRSISLRLPQYTALFFNLKRNPALESTDVRRALAQSIDRDKVLRATRGTDSVAAFGPIPPGFIGYSPSIKKYDFDPAAAEALLDKNGWKKNASGKRVKTSPPAKKGEKISEMPLVLAITTVDNDENVAVAESIKNDLEQVGVDVAVKIVPASKIQKDKIKTRDYDALLYGEIVGPDPDPYPFWHSSQNDENGLNLSLYGNRKADEILEKARAAINDAERASLYEDFQNLLADDVPAVFLYSPTYSYAMSKKVNGVAAATVFSPADRFADVCAWYMEKKWKWKR